MCKIRVETEICSPRLFPETLEFFQLIALLLTQMRNGLIKTSFVMLKTAYPYSRYIGQR